MKKNSFSSNKNKRNKTPSLPNKSSKEQKNELPIIDLLKCPICKNICLMNINRDKLLFSFECNNNHNNPLKKSKTYINSNESYLNSDINLISEKQGLKIINKDNNTSNPTYTIDSQKNGKKLYITENEFSCPKHNIIYQSYCNDCKENICDECLKAHLTHNKIILKTIKPKENVVLLCKNDVIKKEEELNNIIEKMMKWKKEFEFGLNTIIKIMQNIFNLKQFVVMNYDTRQSNQNYNYIQNFNNMKVIDFIFPELQEFFKEKHWKTKGHILIEIIISIQNKIIENKEKLKIMKLKEEIDKKTEMLKKKIEIQEKNMSKNKKKEVNVDDNIDMESVDTAHSFKRKNYNTTFNSDCLNNNYFCRNVSRRMVNNINHAKKKIIEKRNKNRGDNNLSHTIEQNKELEKKMNQNENNNEKIEESIVINRFDSKNRNISTNFYNTQNIEDSQNMNNLNSNKEDKNINNIENIHIKNSELNNINNYENNNFESNNINIINENNNFESNNINDNNENNNFESNNINIINENNMEFNNINTNNDNNIEFNVINNENNIEFKNINNENNNSEINKNDFINENNNSELNNINNNDKIIENNQNEINEENQNLEELNENLENKIDSLRLNDEIKSDKENIILRNKNSNRNREKYTYKNIQLKYELTNTDIIRSIEFTNNNLILICTLENISIYKMNPDNYELIKVYDIKEFNYRINYAAQLSNDNLIICSLNNIDIIKLFENDESLSYTLIQKINGKNDSYNINKVIEIKEKDLLISCDKNNLIKYLKNKETNLYEEIGYISTDSEVKCIELINDNLFVAVEPEEQCIIFYQIDNIESTHKVNNIQSSFGRYVISFIPQNNCIFVTGSQGIYLISTQTLELIKFFKIGEWISSISYDYFNEYLMCGTWKKNTFNEQKSYNLILYKINEDNLSLDNMTINEVERKKDIHIHDIVVIKPSEEGFILTGSNDRTVKLWK